MIRGGELVTASPERAAGRRLAPRRSRLATLAANVVGFRHPEDGVALRGIGRWKQVGARLVERHAGGVVGDAATVDRDLVRRRCSNCTLVTRFSVAHGLRPCMGNK